MLATLARHAEGVLFNVAAAIFFVAALALGYLLWGGLDFVQGWGGGIAAVIATYFLIWKSSAYWVWMIVNAALWTALFFHNGLPLLAWLQISFLALATYGFIQWALVKYRIGFNPHVRSDVVGCVIALGVFLVSIYAYRNMPGYTGTTWWWVEVLSVFTAIAAMWMDAFRYRMNWVSWSVSNCFSAPLFWHFGLAGPFWTIFVYQAFNIVGWVQWTRDERRMRASKVREYHRELDRRGWEVLDHA